MKRIFALLVAMMMVVFMTACGGTDAGNDNAEPKNETTGTTDSTPESMPESTPEATPDGTADSDVSKKPSGIEDDGMGYDPSYGEGIGEVVALSDEEKEYVAAQTTDTWLELTAEKKDELVVLIGRWLEDDSGFIVENYEDLVVMLDRQMEQYFKNGVNESVLATVCDICGADMPADVPGRAG